MNLWRDLVYAARILRQAPGFTLIAVVVLAIGIGANCAIFTLVDAVLFRPLPFAQPEKLVRLFEQSPGHYRNPVSPLNFHDWNEQNTVFSSMAAVSGGSKTLITPSGAERIGGQSVTVRFFDLLGVAPIVGRTFIAEDEKPGTHVIVLSETMWRKRFGGDPKILGSTLKLEGDVYTVIGIMPASFEILYRTEFWTLFSAKGNPEERAEHYLRVFGRLKDGITIDQARANMNVIAQNLAQAWPVSNKGWGITVWPLRQATVSGELRTTSLVLAGVVGFVLLMACANVANLLLIRGAGRMREVAVRAALGGSQARILAQLLTESGLLAVLGGAAGVSLAWAIVRAAPSFLPADTLPAAVTLALDGRVVFFAVGMTMLTGLLFGLAPALHTAKVSLTEALRSGGRTATGTGVYRSALAVVEIAVAVMLVTGAGLLLRTLSSLDHVDGGFRADHVLTMDLSLSNARYPKPQMTWDFYRAVQREVASLPGVRSAAFSTNLPMQGWDIGQAFELVDHPIADRSLWWGAHYQIVTPAYFETLSIPLLAGRAFNDHDDEASTQVCIVNEEFIREHLKGRDPIGVKLHVSGMGENGPVVVTREIVGVIRQVKVDGPGEPGNSIEIYVPAGQNSWYWGVLSVKTAGDPLAMTQAVKAAIARVDKNQPVTQIRTMEEVVSETIAQPRFRAQLVGAFAALALVLAAVGIFGVLAFSVSQRTREFGIRMALGAQAGDVLRMVLNGGLRITALGIAIGLIAAAGITRSLASLLFGVKPIDPVTFFIAPLLLALVALVACAIPALRAARVDPAVALRQD